MSALSNGDLAPPQGPERHFPAGDIFVLAVLMVLSLVLMPAWAESGIEYVPDFLAQMLGAWTLPALGLLWVVRSGSVDLSVWAGFAIGASVTGAVVGKAVNPTYALAAAAAAGAALGGINALGVGVFRLPGWGATGMTAIAGVSVAEALAPRAADPAPPAPAGLVVPDPGRLPPEALGAWSGVVAPLLLVGGLFIVALLGVMLAARLAAKRRVSPRLTLSAALLGSGMLSSLGGLCWVARSGFLPTSVPLVGDLRVIAGVVLSGAVVLRGAGRGLSSAALLPPAMLLATIWQQRVWDVPQRSLPVNVIVLAVMVLVPQWAIGLGRGKGASAGRIPHWPVGAMFVGIILLAATAADMPAGAESALRILGAGLWVAGAAGAGAHWLLLRARRGGPAGENQPPAVAE